MGTDFDPLGIPHDERRFYRYEGPEIIYTFWAKHGPCQVTGCGHRTPIMTKPVMAVKTHAVKHWEHRCNRCDGEFDVEQTAARMAPDVPLVVASDEKPFSIHDPRRGTVCPYCGHADLVKLGKGKNKKVNLSLLVHPQWLAGSPEEDENGQPYGGSAQDDPDSTARWNQERAARIRLLEVRGDLPEEVTCPETKLTFKTGKEGGTVPKKSNYACGACGAVQDVLTTVKATGKTGPMAAYAIQGYAPERDSSGARYGGRFFAAFNEALARQYDAATTEWNARKDDDLADYWPKEMLFPYEHGNDSKLYIQPQHGFTHWWMMFNPRQLLVHGQLLKAIMTSGDFEWTVREFVLGAFQQYLRNQCMFSFWNPQRDTPEPMFSNNNYHPKSTVIENCVFPDLGRGNWSSCVEGVLEGREWAVNPWEAVSIESLKRYDPLLAGHLAGKSEKVFPGDQVLGAEAFQGSSTQLDQLSANSMDLIITDPPFGSLIHYSDLADFFNAWLSLVLKCKYPNCFGSEHTPKAIEAIANKALEPDDPDGFYQRLLTQCWREANRVLKPSGILSFTFHHSEDEPWVAVLESLFDAGFYLEATYPIRSDETKGEGEFGSKTIEYDIIHVCRKRTEEPRAVSWGRMRREVLGDVRRLQTMLENHAKEGLPAADLQVIRRGKALEYFSRHYGKVYIGEDRTVSVRDALIGINQLIDEDANRVQELPPVNAEPITRQFLRIFEGKTEIARDQMQKFLRGSGVAPDEFEQRGWCNEKTKIFRLVEPLEFARDWQGRHKRKLTSDLDQALVLIGACFDGSGINASDTLKNENFKPHAALKALLEWMWKCAANQQTRNAASRALSIYNTWAASHQEQVKQMTLFFDEA